ncbi:YggN family protein [Lysobacter solisilvae (ex Woo and Kim 2020)]|uniref:DUF2884 family protein n=1 Tax=Agrilutibacter terrestris TaxID=2865112 RepID=A0A7H0FXS5_9GAMM|nr:hypothetical protein [Lysobacter terrestris]QNP40841.1 hypothetical protein H8B22_00805 [Lysobacter terrestris]
MNRKHIAVLLIALSPLVAQAGTVKSEVEKDLDDARQEIRTEMAQERAKLGSENLTLGDGLHFGKEDQGDAKRRHLPKGEITPRGDLLIDGKAVAIDAGQRRQLLDYRAQVIDIARTGLVAGEKAAMLAIEATDVSLFRLIVGGLSGSLERKVEATVQREIQPMVLQICRRLPQLRDSQQALAASVPEFRPYATLDRDDVENCERDIRKDMAAR